MAEDTQSGIPDAEPLGLVYEPLADATTDLRLLQVLHRHRNGRIQVHMWNVPVDEKDLPNLPEYRCLSYTWGVPDAGYEIYLNGCLVKVRHNLHEFLIQAANSIAMQPLWIDALCIDQNSVDEKNIQVTKMGLIYSRAQAVLVWLGTDAALIPVARYITHHQIGHQPQDNQTDMEASFGAFWGHPYWTRTCECVLV